MNFKHTKHLKNIQSFFSFSSSFFINSKKCNLFLNSVLVLLKILPISSVSLVYKYYSFYYMVSIIIYSKYYLSFSSSTSKKNFSLNSSIFYYLYSSFEICIPIISLSYYDQYLLYSSFFQLNIS